MDRDKQLHLLEKFEIGDPSREILFEREVSALQRLAGHPLIAKIKSIFYDLESGGAAFIQLQYPANGTIRSWLYGQANKNNAAESLLPAARRFTRADSTISDSAKE